MANATNIREIGNHAPKGQHKPAQGEQHGDSRDAQPWAGFITPLQGFMPFPQFIPPTLPPMPIFTPTLVAFDLDDTLYKEIDYLKSAYREIALHAAHGNRSLADKAFGVMLQAYEDGDNAFLRLNELLGTETPISEYLAMYRTHRPDILLEEDVVATLDALKTAGCTIALITDGRSVQQRNKIVALGLNRWIADEDIVISEETGSEKPSEANYRRLMELHPDAGRFVYIGDNPKKDFIAPNRLGWTTVCLLDNGENIHPQRFGDIPQEAQPQYKAATWQVMRHGFNFYRSTVAAPTNWAE